MNSELSGLPPFALVVGWVIWCTLHSVLISPGITRYSRRMMGRGFRFYRFGYVLFSLVTLIPLIYISKHVHQTIVFTWEGYYRMIPLSGIIVAVFLFIVGGKQYDWAEFLGLRQMQTGLVQHTLSPGNELATSGILGVIRHPWYAACFPLFWAQDLSSLSIQINTVLTVYVIIGTLLEERKLVAEFGDHYRDYQRRVSMFFPWKWILAKLSRQQEG